MNTFERMTRMYAHQEADWVPVTDSPWGSTLARWRREGLPEGSTYVDFFGLDRFETIHADNGPRFPSSTVEETDEYRIHRTSWGATLKDWKKHGGVPEFLDFTITGPDEWRKARERMAPGRDRIDWESLKRNFKTWRGQGAWISAGFWFGFDVTHSWMVGTERTLEALVTDPEWIVDLWNHHLDVDMGNYQLVLDAGYRFDEISWPDDMGYKENQFFSLAMYRNLLKPVHRRAAEWAHARGLKVRLHSCGDVRPLVPDLIELGVDMLNPLEVKAGMNPVELKRRFGDRLGFHGGLNAVLYGRPGDLEAEMRTVIPVMKEHGGYVIGSDHSVPDSVSLDQFREFVRLARELGAY
ncbi:MAG: uroporphyrinogen decarboxylase family protein [Candidatus Coatesbacteria bacterium]